LVPASPTYAGEPDIWRGSALFGGGLLSPRSRARQRSPGGVRRVRAQRGWDRGPPRSVCGMMVIVAGLLALFLVLNGQPGRSVWAGPFGAAAAVLALGLYGILQAVDGVALKHAVDACASGGAAGALRERRDDPMARAPITTA